MKMMMMMMSTSSSTNHHNQIISEDQEQSTISSSTCPVTWKLYNNPFYSSNNTPNHSSNPLKLQHLQRKYSANAKYIHHLQSDFKMSSFTNLSDHQLNQAGTQIAELKSELEMERKLRKKMEILNKKLSKELIDQAEKSREKVFVLEDLNKEISRLKEEMVKMKKDMEEERKMLRMAEVLREERVQMKLANAHLFYNNPPLTSNVGDWKRSPTLSTSNSSSNGSHGGIKNANVQRKASPEAENPHIKQGIKGFVEFQRAIKARNGSNNSSSSCSSVGSYKQLRDLGSYSKVECQKAQLRVFFKHRGSLPYSHSQNLILS